MRYFLNIKINGEKIWAWKMAQSVKHWLFKHQGLNSGPGRQVKMPGGAALASHSGAEEMGTSGYLGPAVSLD